jgi:hypothetical protein
MAYQINRFNRSLLTTVEDGTLDETTDIKFVGKNYAGYGEAHNENFLFLLENFSGANEPPKPISGQLWFDSGAQRMKFRDSNNKWRTVGGAEVSASQPAGLATGDFWWDSANEQLYVYNGTEFILIGPQDAGDGITQMLSRTVIDTTDVSRSVIVAYVNDVPIHIISPSAAFTIKNVAGNTIDGFGTVRQGITLRDTDNDNGITSSAYRFHGTATNADKLGGLNASEFARTADPSFDQQIEALNGIVVADVFSYTVENGFGGDEDYGIIANTSGPNNEIKFRTKNAQGTLTDSIKIKHDGAYPVVNDTIDLGSSSLTFDNVYANSFKGIADQANELRHGVDGNDYRYASEANVAGTIAVRDANKTITADIFNGIASQARFADLAEKYTVAVDHPVGTVMMICEHEGHEMCPCKLSSFPVGVISEKPAYLMNKSLKNAQAIALEGRVPVRVIGAVKKGDLLYVDANGCASTVYTGNPRIGVALESNDNESEKLVEAILKL